MKAPITESSFIVCALWFLSFSGLPPKFWGGQHWQIKAKSSIPLPHAERSAEVPLTDPHLGRASVYLGFSKGLSKPD